MFARVFVSYRIIIVNAIMGRNLSANSRSASSTRDRSKKGRKAKSLVSRFGFVGQGGSPCNRFNKKIAAKEQTFQSWSQEWRIHQMNTYPHIYKGQLPGSTQLSSPDLQERVARIVDIMNRFGVDAHTAHAML